MNAIKGLANEGKLDRIVRVIFGAALLSLVFVGPETVWGMLGLIPLVTGAMGFCPIYKVIGIDTCGKQGCSKSA